MRRLIFLFSVLALVAFGLPPSTQAIMSSLDCTAMQASTSSTGNGNLCPVSGYSTLTMQVAGTFAALTVVNFEATVDGTNFVALPCFRMPLHTNVNNAYAAGVYTCLVRGFARARARISVAGTSVTVAGIALDSTAIGTNAF